MRGFLSLLLFVILIVLFFTFFSPKVEAVTFTGQTSTGSIGSFDYDFESNECSKITDSEVTTTDLSPCQDAIGPHQNTCCTSSGGCTAADESRINLWDYNFASGCTAKLTFLDFCSLSFKYQTQTCPSTDTCRVEPYLYPGLCTANGCAIGTVKYKTCCNANGTVNGNCSGGDYTGVCTSDYNVVCGVSSCEGVAGNCTTLPCGEAACNAFKKTTPGLCPGTGIPTSGWGGSCNKGESNRPATCNSSNACETCSSAACQLYKTNPDLYCWFNNGQCYNDKNFCAGFGICKGKVCTPGEQRTVCGTPNSCTIK